MPDIINQTINNAIGGISDMAGNVAGEIKGVFGNDPISGLISAAKYKYGAGIIANSALGIFIVFQYNPKTLTDEFGDTWKETEVQGTSSPLRTFQCGGSKTKHFEILLDAHASPHPLQHVGQDLDDIEMLAVPYDKAGLPIVLPPKHGIRVGAARTKSEEVVGIPPLVKIVYGGRVQKGLIRSLQVEEQLHGTTPIAYPLMLPTRARVTFNFYIVDDPRMVVTYKMNAAGAGGGPSPSAGSGPSQLTP